MTGGVCLVCTCSGSDGADYRTPATIVFLRQTKGNDNKQTIQKSDGVFSNLVIQTSHYKCCTIVIQ